MEKKIKERGQAILRNPLLNKGTSFTEQERKDLQLFGFIPCNTETIESELLRARMAFSAKQTPLEQHIYLRSLQDRNEVLFYRFVLDNLEEMMPIIYTPTVGEACQLFHIIYRNPRGLFISYPEQKYLDLILKSTAETRDIRVIVVTDGERILGLGDQGAGGLGIPIGKLSLYTACGGIDPAYTLPIVLDVGTNNQKKLADPEYLGWRHARLTGNTYYEFVDRFVQGIKKYFPNALLQFEDFAQQHAYPLLEKYQDELCCFNDDIQGTAAVTVAAILAAAAITKKPLKEHTIALLGAGSAGCGISEQLVQAMMRQGLNEKEARARFFLVDRFGLLKESQKDLLLFQKKFAKNEEALKPFKCDTSNTISLMDVIHNVKPTILLGVSGQPNQFTEEMVESMASYCKRPIIFPLSNPTSRAEAQPSDLIRWTKGAALVATGSPFNAVVYNGHHLPITQCNNSYIFPGMGLAILASRAKRVTNNMMMAAAIALSEFTTVHPNNGGEIRLLPELNKIRDVSKHIARAVILQGVEDKVIDPLKEDLDALIEKTMWVPDYQIFKAQ